MFQKEVAQRIGARAKTEDYGLLTVIAQTFWETATVSDAGPKDFFPPPNVASRVLVFRKRALKPGSGIGYHEQTEDEIYYVLSGRGIMTLDGKEVEVGPGTAILTRTGSSHGLKQTGAEDLVILINYQQ